MKKEEAPKLTKHDMERLKRDPDFQYRYVGKDKDSADKIAARKDDGYEIVGDGERVVLMRCRKDEFMERQKAAQDAAQAQMKANKMRGGDGFASVKSEVTQTNEVAVAMRKQEE